MTQKGELYSKMFSTFSAVRQLHRIWSQLNILCTSPVKQYYTKITIFWSCHGNKNCMEFHRSRV